MKKQTKPLKRPYTHKKVAPKQSRSRLPSLLKFVPASLLFLLAFTIHTPAAQSRKSTASVLSYATSISQSDLLNQTNAQRSGNSVASLSLNGQLNSAAQAKANDMVTRDYWAHVAPDGKQPWDFMTEAGYQYTTAGENLAYGFANAGDTVTGWMNSPPHRENLLNPAFSEAGFGFADSANYVGTGQETVVVAMYGAPQNQAVAPASSQQSMPPANPNSQPTALAEGTPQSEPIQTAPAATEETTKPDTKDAKTTATTADAPTPKQPLAAAPSTVSRIQLLTGGNAAWSRTLLVTSVVSVTVLWMLQRGFQVRRTLRAGELYVLRHLHVDFTIFGFIALGWTLLQATGSIR